MNYFLRWNEKKGDIWHTRWGKKKVYESFLFFNSHVEIKLYKKINKQTIEKRNSYNFTSSTYIHIYIYWIKKFTRDRVSAFENYTSVPFHTLFCTLCFCASIYLLSFFFQFLLFFISVFSVYYFFLFKLKFIFQLPLWKKEKKRREKGERKVHVPLSFLLTCKNSSRYKVARGCKKNGRERKRRYGI